MCILLVRALLQGGNCGRTQYWKECFLNAIIFVVSGFIRLHARDLVVLQYLFKFPQSCFCETSGQEIKLLISYTCALIASIIIMDPLLYMYLSCLIP